MKTHYIITYTGSHYGITAQQENKLQTMKSTSKLDIDGNTVIVSSIAEVMTREQYYKTFPDKRPPSLDIYKDQEGMGMEGIISASRKDALKGLFKGLNSYINSDKYQGTKAPIELRNKIQIRLDSIT